uniref:Saposin B-type domain-containing protein n=1 Tax=Strongyloides venezuelensis TaxID=75913 RepID=A0A0K0FI43_STRVS
MKFLVFLLLILKITLTFEQKPLCQPCIEVVDKIKQLGQDKDEIIKELSDICDRIFFGNQFLDTACKKYVVEGVDAITQKIEKLGNSTMVCHELHFC